MSAILEVQNLSVSFDTPRGEIQAVRDVSLAVAEGEVLAVVGETGCGKSVLCKSILKLLPDIARIKEGHILLDGVDITGYRERDMRLLRGKFCSMVFQNPMTALNPSLPVGAQIAEAVKVHRPGMSRQDVEHRVAELMDLVGIDHPTERKKQYPHHLSGGMRQRSVMAIALAAEPRLLFADEPTTALDVTIQAQILDLLKEMQARLHTAMVFITHDLGVAARVADRVAVMYAGRIAEIGTAEEVFHDPRHPYTWGLMRAVPAFARGRDSLYAIPGMPPVLIDPPKGDAFACRNEYALAIDYEEQPPMFPVTKTHYAATWLLDERAGGLGVRAPAFGSFRKENDGRCCETQRSKGQDAKRPLLADTASDILLDVQHLSHVFPLPGQENLQAVDDVSFQIRNGEIFGLIGESGSGKSTVARCIMNVYKPTDGQIIYQGIDVCNPKAFRANRKMLQSARQIIFQDSDASLNQRKKVCDIIAEPMKLHHVKPPRGTYRAEAAFQMRAVGLDEGYLDQYPAALSGGQRQRVAIARMLLQKAPIMVFDDSLSAVDTQTDHEIRQALKRHMQDATVILISHRITTLMGADRILVLNQGRVEETGTHEELIRRDGIYRQIYEIQMEREAVSHGSF